MSGLDLKFNKVLYFPGNTLPSSPSVIVPTGFRVSCCWGFFFSLSGFDLCSVALLARVLWVSPKVSTQLCSQPKGGLSWADCKSQSFQHGLSQCLVLTLLHTEIYTSQQAAQGLLLSSTPEFIPAPAYCKQGWLQERQGGLPLICKF